MVIIDYDLEGQPTYFDVYYIIDLDTRQILTRVDDPEGDELEKEIEDYSKRVTNIEVVRALQWREK